MGAWIEFAPSERPFHVVKYQSAGRRRHKLIVAGMKEPADCIGRDVSRPGISIVVTDVATIPASFKLTITGVGRSCNCKCKVTRRATQTLGVRFTG